MFPRDRRAVLAGFGFGAILLLAVPLPLVMRRQPEDVGLLPDGDAHPTAAAGQPTDAKQPASQRQWTFRESVKTVALWLILITLHS